MTRDKKTSKKLFRLAGTAISDYTMIKQGDRILVGLSGGKDSWVLLTLLDELRKKAPLNFDIEAIHVYSDSASYDLTPLHEHCQKIYIPFTVLNTAINRIIVENKRPGSSNCSFCARLRRGVLYNFASEHNFNKIALGHHRDDFIETLLLNQFFAGKTKSMTPCRPTDSYPQLTIIRPLAYISEDKIEEFACDRKLPIIKPFCPYFDHKNSKRHEIKELLIALEQENPSLRSNLFHALQSVETSHLLDLQLSSNTLEKTNKQKHD